jgi:hypothetical protein
MFDKVAIEAIVGFVVVMWEMLKLQYEKLWIKKKAEFMAHELEKQELSSSSASMKELLVHLAPLRSLSGNYGDNGYRKKFDIIIERGKVRLLKSGNK